VAVAAGPCETGDVEEVRLGEAEGLRHGERLVDELTIRCDKVHLQPNRQQRAQCQQRFDRQPQRGACLRGNADRASW
jgi:hypothetical protein